jgi:tetratricopeptide (TPR) repeat protein
MINAKTCLLLLWLAAPLLLPGQTETPSSNQLAFANRLFEEKDFYRAITEYKRFIHLYPQDPAVDEARLAIAFSYFRSEKWDAAWEGFQSVQEEAPASEAACRARLMAAEAAYRKEDFPAALDAFTAFAGAYPNDPAAPDARMRAVQCYFHLGRNQHAARQARQAAETHSRDERLAALVKDADSPDLPAKSPVLAGTLSALLPGAGQLYVGRPRDAGISFLLNGSLIALAATAFHNDEPVAGSVLSLVGLTWYTGNIYGAASGAHKYNRDRRRRFIESLEIQYGIMQNADRDFLPAGGLRVRF